MNLITKYKLFEGKEVTKESIEELAKKYLLNKDFYDYFKSNGIELNFTTDIALKTPTNEFWLKITYQGDKDSRLTISMSKFNAMNLFDNTLIFNILYNGYTLYQSFIQVEFTKNIFDIYDNIKDFFINSHREILSTPFIGTKKDVDNLEKLMMLLYDTKKYSVYLSKDGVQKVREISDNPNYTNDLPKDLEFLKNIKYLTCYYSDKDSTIFLYAKFDHGTELIQMHEQYAYLVYKMYKKIANK